MNDKQKITAAMTAAGNYYRFEVTPEYIDLTMKLIPEIPADAVVECIAAHMRDPERGRFMPRACDITAQYYGTAKEVSDSALVNAFGDGAAPGVSYTDLERTARLDAARARLKLTEDTQRIAPDLIKLGGGA